jgi:superfamily I DNA/RNA helicase
VPQVLLMTLHASKGLEFDCVFVIGVNEGFLPLWKYVQDDGTNPLIQEVRIAAPLAPHRSVGRTGARGRTGGRLTHPNSP